MNTLEGYDICYPQIQHPLISEKEDLKKKYISLLKFYADKFCPDDQIVLYRLKAFYIALLGKNDLSDVFLPDEQVTKHTGVIMKTRFTPFRLFSITHRKSSNETYCTQAINFNIVSYEKAQ